MVGGKKFTILWYVDDKKMPHVDPNLVTDIIEEIKKNFGYMVISRGDTHNLLGMTIKIRKDKKVGIIMKHTI